MDKKKQDLQGEVPTGHTFIPTEMGSARFVSLDGEGSAYKYEAGSAEGKGGSVGPPWGVEDSMHFVCDEVGVDYNKFINALQSNRSDTEIAKEFDVSQGTVEKLKDRFYKGETIHGNYGQD